jgi:GMP synthase PP-ATPase subunit
LLITKNPLSRRDLEHIFQRSISNIQGQHNVGGLPAAMHLKLIESFA